MSSPIVFFLIFIALTLAITYWASKQSTGSAAYFAAGRRIMGWQNGFAIAGDFMSAASFLGVVGLISLFGVDCFVFAWGGLVAFMAVLLIVAEPLRNVGKYTMADMLAYRHRVRPVTAMAAVSTLVISTFYMIVQMVGAGALVALLLKNSGVSYSMAVIGVGTLMMVYVVFGGMLATTWVQIVKAMLLMSCTVVLTILVLRHFHFSFGELFAAASQVTSHAKGQEVVRDFLQPGLRFKSPYGPFELLSLIMVFLFGTAGLPHILSRFYTVPDAKTARISVVWAMVLIGAFFIMTSILGLGAATILGPDYIMTPWRHEYEHAAAGPVHGGRHLLRLCLGGSVCHDFGGCVWTDDQCLHFVCARFLDQRDSSRSRAQGGGNRAGGKGRSLRRSRCVHDHCHPAGTDGQRHRAGYAGDGGWRFGQFPGDRALDLLAAIQYRRSAQRTDCRVALVNRIDPDKPDRDGD